MKIDGVQIAKTILSNLKQRVLLLKKAGVVPHLAIFLINRDPASVAYVNQKEIKGKRIGAEISVKHLSSDVSEKKLLTIIKQFNNDNNIHGIIIQRPLPKNIDSNKVSVSVDPKKDADGFHPNSKFFPPIALAILRVLEQVYHDSPRRSPFDPRLSSRRTRFAPFHLRGGVAPAAHLGGEFRRWLSSQKIVIVGKGQTGGKPVIEMLRKMKIEPQIIDTKTKNPWSITKKADIIISAVGKPNVVNSEMLKRGAILIGVGLYKGNDGKMHGDYEEDKIKNIASFYAPTPGGVGPVNVAMLLENLVKAAEDQSSQVSS